MSTTASTDPARSVPADIEPTREAGPRAGVARLRYSYDVVTHLVAREFRLRYRRALFGWLWAIVTPLLRFAILAFVFTKIIPLGVPHYPEFLFAGLIAWMWFAGGVMSATTSAVDRRDLMFRPGLPRAVVPIVSVLTDGIDYVAALPMLAVVLMVGQGMAWTALALPLLLLLQLLLTVGLGYMLCAAHVYFRDVGLFVGVALMLGFYATPVFYSADQIPAPYARIIMLNPMARLLGAYRDVLVFARMPSLTTWLVLIAICLGICVAGYAVYSKASPNFVDEL